jgi:hypothetical protein
VTDLSLWISFPKIGMQHSAKSDSLNNAMSLSLTAKGGERNRGVAFATANCLLVYLTCIPLNPLKGTCHLGETSSSCFAAVFRLSVIYFLLLSLYCYIFITI